MRGEGALGAAAERARREIVDGEAAPPLAEVGAGGEVLVERAVVEPVRDESLDRIAQHNDVRHAIARRHKLGGEEALVGDEAAAALARDVAEEGELLGARHRPQRRLGDAAARLGARDLAHPRRRAREGGVARAARRDAQRVARRAHPRILAVGPGGEAAHAAGDAGAVVVDPRARDRPALARFAALVVVDEDVRVAVGVQHAFRKVAVRRAAARRRREPAQRRAGGFVHVDEVEEAAPRTVWAWGGSFAVYQSRKRMGNHVLLKI